MLVTLVLVTLVTAIVSLVMSLVVSLVSFEVAMRIAVAAMHCYPVWGGISMLRRVAMSPVGGGIARRSVSRRWVAVATVWWWVGMGSGVRGRPIWGRVAGRAVRRWGVARGAVGRRRVACTWIATTASIGRRMTRW